MYDAEELREREAYVATTQEDMNQLYECINGDISSFVRDRERIDALLGSFGLNRLS